MTNSLILAAGEGKRLRPLTNKIPKCLVPFFGKTILQRQINTLKKEGINFINIAAGHQHNKIKKLGYPISINKNYKTTNMVKTMFLAMELYKKKEDLVVSYGDIIYQNNNLKKLLSCNKQIAVMIDLNWKSLWSLRFKDPLIDAETLSLDKEGNIIEIGRKTQNYENIQGQYTGLIKLRGDIIEDLINFYKKMDKNKTYFNKKFKDIFMTDFLQILIDNGYKVKSVPIKSGWLEIDTISDLNLYKSLHKRGNLIKFYRIE